MDPLSTNQKRKLTLAVLLMVTPLLFSWFACEIIYRCEVCELRIMNSEVKTPNDQPRTSISYERKIETMTFVNYICSTGIFIPFTPGHIFSVASFPVVRGLTGEIFCRVLGNRYALFTLGKVSILKVTCLALERWYCIFRPIMYKHYFARKRVFLYILAIWVCTCILQINKFFEWKLSGSKCSNVKGPYGEKGTKAMIVIYSLIGFYFPCLITWASFAHITLLFKTSPMARCYGERQRAQQRALLRMCAATSITLTLCWLPAQTIYVLTTFGITTNTQPVHQWGGVLALFNSCVNPLIYWMTNKEYRAGLFKLFMFAKAVELFRKGGYTLENQKCS